ncbi:MAG: hypothetical protein ACRELY_28025 [Polyangiaceae bacterium]
MAKKKKPERRRREQRFYPQSNANPWVVRAIGGVGAILLGAGAYEQFIATTAPWKYTPHMLALGALAFAMSIWFGTSGDPILRVGDAGVGLDRGLVERIPWWGVTEITFDPKIEAVVVAGKDESGKKAKILAKLKSQPQAAAWIAKEANERIPKLVDISGESEEKIPEPRAKVGDVMLLEPLQIVGKRCAATDKIIAYEPDARVCPRCERVYYKKSVPKKCECGALLAALRDPSLVEEDDDEDEEEETEASTETETETETATETATKTTADEEEEEESETHEETT